MPGYVWTLSKVQRCLQLQFYYFLFAPLRVAKSHDATERPRYQTPDKLSQCRSINFNWVHFLCELNKADVHIAPQSLITSKGFVYLDNPWIKFQLVS